VYIYIYGKIRLDGITEEEEKNCIAGEKKKYNNN